MSIETPEDRSARLARLLAKARALPGRPGVYLMKDAQGVVVYVGKAARLCDRVSSYFLASTDLGPRKAPMLELVEDFETLEYDDHWEALLAENRLIKDIHPKFNALQKDDKSYPYLAITRRDDFPRVLITRQPNDPELIGAKIFGPFVNPAHLRRAAHMLQAVFKFRTCSLPILEGDEKNRFFRPCILHSINRCTAPCAARVSKEQYGRDIDNLVRFLESSPREMIKELTQEMEEAARAMEYEQAALLRDQIRALEKLRERAVRRDGWQPNIEVRRDSPQRAVASLRRVLGLKHSIRCIEGFDIAHLQGNETVGSKVCFIDGKPLKSEYRRYRLREATGNDDYAALKEVISRCYRHAGAGHELYPDVILIDGGPGQLSAALEALGQFDVPPEAVISLAKQEELIYVQGKPEPIRLGRSHPALKLCQYVRDEAHRFARVYHHVLRRRRTFDE